VKRLLRQSRYEIATDIWMSVCLGLRSKDYKRVQLRDGTGAIAKVLQLVERKNNNPITRAIPRSLANMISKHQISYPVTQKRFLEARECCLQNLGSFYGLRSLTITLILSKIASNS
jgi:hypothetical protein